MLPTAPIFTSTPVTYATGFRRGVVLVIVTTVPELMEKLNHSTHMNTHPLKLEMYLEPLASYVLMLEPEDTPDTPE